MAYRILVDKIFIEKFGFYIWSADIGGRDIWNHFERIFKIIIVKAGEKVFKEPDPRLFVSDYIE